MKNKNQTKLYITTDSKNKGERCILYLLMSNKLWVNSYRRIDRQNWIFDIEYDKSKDVNKLIGDHRVRAIKINVRRIFKSYKIRKGFEAPSRTFLDKILILISARIIKKVNIRVVNNNANEWQRELLKRWQSELENPRIFKELNIRPKVNVHPSGKIVFHINKVGDYIITYFAKDISKIYRNDAKESGGVKK